MKNAIVKLGFCLLFICAGQAAFAAPPKPTVVRQGATPTRATSIVFDVTFDQPVTDFDDAGDVVLSGAGAAGASTGITGSGTTYQVTITGHTVNDVINVAIPLNAAENAGAEKSLASDATALSTVTFDNTPPTVTLVKKTTQSATTHTSPIEYTLTGGEALDFSSISTTTSFTFTGSTATGGTLAVSQVLQVSPTEYTVRVTVTGSPVHGNVTLNLASGGVKDVPGNSSTATPSASVEWQTIPVVSAPTVTDITTTSALMGGTVDDDGNGDNVVRGTVWNTNSTVTINDNDRTVGAGTGEGTFTHTRMPPFTPATHYWFRAFATNSIGSGLSSTGEFWTLSNEPENHMPSAATAASSTTINLTFTDYGSSDDTEGFVILRKAGSAITDADVTQGVVPTAQSLYIYHSTSSSADDYSDIDNNGSNDLTPGTTYYYAVIPYNRVSNDATTHYKLGFATSNATLFNKSSLIELDDPAASKLLYATKQATTIAATTDGLEVMKLTLHDGGMSHNDTDNKKTILASVTFSIQNHAMLRKVALFRNGTFIQEKNPAASVTFTLTAGQVEANNNTTQNFQIYASFQNDPLIIDDGAVVKLSVTGATIHPNSSEFAAADAGAATTGNTNNAIEVAATKYVYTGVTNPVNPDAPFGFTATLMDNNNAIDKTIGSTVTLSLPVADGTIGPPAELTKPVVNGVVVFTNIQLSDAGDNRRVTLHSDAAGPPTPPADGILEIDVISLGVSITGPAQTLCFNDASTTSTTFTTLGQIKVKESNKSDFKVGANQTFSLVLPDGFIFDITVVAPAVTVTSTSGAEISALSFVGYTSNNVARIKYSISGITNAALDEFLINGLKVKYTSSTPVGPLNILRIGGSAQISGNDDTDAKSHGTLSAANNIAGTTPVSFKITNSDLQADETNFSKVYSPPIVLQGTRVADGVSVGGTFSGNGVSLDTDGKYKFYPSAVIAGPHDITFTYVNPGGCLTTGTRTFNVFTSVITGLSTQYCEDDPAVTLGSPTNMPTGTCYVFDSFLGIYIPIGPKYTFIDYVFGYSYQGSAITYFSLGSAIGATQFSPSSYAIYTAFGYETYVGYRVQNNCTGGLEPSTLYFRDKININLKPFVTFSGVPANVCETDPAYDLTAPMLNTADGYDLFWASSGVGATPVITNAVTGTLGSPGGFDFVAATALGSSNPQRSVKIFYRHQDPNTGCKNQTSQNVMVYKKPDSPTTAQIKIKSANTFAGEFCRNEAITEFTADAGAVPNVFYNWYDNPKTRTLTPEGNVFSPNSYIPLTGGLPTVGTTTFNVTRTLYRIGSTFRGCESDPQPITVQIFAPTTIDAGPTKTICQGNPLVLDDLNASITSPLEVLDGKWTSTTPSYKRFSLNANGTGLDSMFTSSNYYTPTAAEIAAGSFTLKLTSLDPLGPCTSVSDDVLIKVNPGVVVSFPQIVSPATHIDFCASETAMNVDTEISDITLGFTWTVDNGDGAIQPTPANPKKAQYIPTANELNDGATVVLKVQTADPDGLSGPCDPGVGTMTVKISQRPIVVAGANFEICADQTINLTSRIPPTGNPLGDATKSSASSVTWTAINGKGVINTPNSLSTTYSPFDAPATDPTSETKLTQTLTFQVTSNVPGGLNVCPAESKTMTVILHPRPKAPEPIAFRNYCVGEVVEELKVVGVYPTWYNNSDLAPTHIISSGNTTLLSGVTTNVEKRVDFFITDTGDRNVATGFAGCESESIKMTVVVNPKPIPTFSYENQCFGDVMEFTDGSTLQQPLNPLEPARSITARAWNFGDNLGSIEGAGPIPAKDSQDGRTTGTFEGPGHVFKNTGDYNVSLTVTTSDGCKASYTPASVITVGPVPEAKYTIAKLCDGDETQFTYTGTVADPTTTYAWDFGDAASGAATLSTAKDPKHKFTAFGTYDLRLIVRTNLNCRDTIMGKTSILPYITQFPYVERFEGNHGWVPQGLNTNNLSSWTLVPTLTGVPNDPNQAAGGNFWITNTNVSGVLTYNNDERSALNGPCVDMTKLARPVIAMDYWNDTDTQSDGAYLEYRDETDINNPGPWTRLGDNTSGLNWYDQGSIGGLSTANGAGQNLGQFGWSGRGKEWKTGRYNLDALAGKTRVRFRLMFGSNGNQPLNTDPFRGFALDYFKLETRNRLVLVENFTTRSTSAAVTGNRDAFKTFPNAAAVNEVVKIEYHTGIPFATGDPADPIFTQNPMDPNARASFYGLSAVPRGYIDGYTATGSAGNGMLGTTNGNITNWAQTFYNTQSLVTSPLDIVINAPTIVNGLMTITGTVTAKEFDLKANNYSLYVAVVEQSVGSDGFVLRKMLPSASGKKVPATLKGQSFTFNETWSIDKSRLGEDPKLVAIAFVQSDIANPGNGAKEVLQAAFNNAPTVNFTTGVELTLLEQTALYPNPADRIVYIELPQTTATGVEVKVIDQVGRPVIQSAIRVGEKSTSIDTGGLAGAVYIIQLKENGVYTNRRLLITHKH